MSTEKVQDAELKYGYVVAVDKDNNLVFQTFGKDMGIVELIGLHDFATEKVKFQKELEYKVGFPMTTQYLAQLAQLIKDLQGSSEE